MAAPTCVIAPIAPPTASFDITAMTGGDMSGLPGFQGKDYNFFQGVEKDGGGSQLGRAFFGPIAFTWDFNYPGGITINSTDSTSGSILHTKSVAFAVNDVAPVGWFCNPIADQQLRVLTWHGMAWGGPWVVTATLSDGSLPPATYTLPNSNDGLTSGFTVTYRALQADSTLRLEMKKSQNGLDPRGHSVAEYVIYIDSVTPARMPGALRALAFQTTGT
jgi:hypothetical protein